MPFTLAHPAAIVVLLRQRAVPVVPMALVAGAMAPDLPYFVPFGALGAGRYMSLLNGISSHGFTQILLVGMPLALLLAGILWFLDRPVRWAIPESWIPEKHSLGPRPPSTAHAVLWTFHSLLIGLLTHLVWDSFTHSTGWVVRHVALLSHEPFAGMPIYRLIQHASSLAGLAVLLMWYLSWRRTSITHKEVSVAGQRTVRTMFLLLIILVPAAVAALLGLGAAPVPEDAASSELFLQVMILRAGSALLASLAIYAAIWHGANSLRKRLAISAARF